MSDQPSRGKPTDQPGVVLRDHVYDGIEEYDQKLPNWWLFTFYIMVVWFVVYWVMYYQLGWFQSDEERIDMKIAALEAKRDEELQKMMATLNDGALWEMSRDPLPVAAGKAIFQAKCVACHGEDLSAYNADGLKLAGLPLDDTEWKYGGNPMDVFKIVNEGSPNLLSGMISWKTQLSPADIAKVSAFVMSKHEEGADWTTAPPDDPAAPGATPAPASAPAPAPTPTPPAEDAAPPPPA